MFGLSFSSVTILLHVAIFVRLISVRVAPLVMPEGRIKGVALGLLGAIGGSTLGGLVGLGPRVDTVHFGAGTVYLGGAILGCLLVLLFAGMLPFLKIMVGRG